ncbi:MAG: hypothetical protein K2H45_00135, partial [Acetatifactor sp.]|nr:hypothetical protein [Acetatifactor sp.]
ATVLAFGETHTERRIRNVLEQKRRGRGITLLVALAAAAGGFIFLTVPQGTQAGMLEKDQVSNNSGQPADGGQQGQREKLQNFVLSEGQVETFAGSAVTLQLVLTEGTYTSYQVPGSTAAENYEGIYELRTLDAQGQILDKVELVNEQGGNTMSFAYRDFPWYFEDYNLDGQQDFFMGTKAADGRSYHYLFTVTAEGGLEYLFDGPMWESYIPMTAQDITFMGLESGGGEHDFREMFLYQANEEYSSHDFYNWSPYFEKYRKRVEFTGAYPEGWNQDAVDYLEGEWHISGIDMWNQDLPRPDDRIGEILNYTGGAFRQLDTEGNVVYENNMAGCSSLVQSSEEFWDTYNMAWFTADAENARRILVNLGEECRLGNVIYVLGDNSMLVYDSSMGGAFWTATRVDLRGEAAEVQQYLQGTWEVTGIAGRPYEALELEEAEALLGTRLTYDWQNTAHEYTIEGPWNDSAYSMPIQGFGQFINSSSDWLPETELPDGEILCMTVSLGEGEFFGIDMLQMDEDTVWIYYEGTLFVAERVL